MKVDPHVSVLSKGSYDFSKLNTSTRTCAEYIWIGGTDLDIRSKTMVLNTSSITDIFQLPDWNYDGSSTDQASGHDSEISLKPRKFIPDPFRGGNHVIVLCDTLNPDGTPAKASFRSECAKIMELCVEEEPWFGIEQEYTLYRIDKYPHWPLGFPDGGYPVPQGPYYCSVGGEICFGRQIMEAHLACCIHCGLDISGTNAEVMPGQWEYQIGPCVGIDAADQLWLSRYLLLRVAEHYGVGVNFECKPIRSNEWNGTGCHTNYSTKSTRGEDGLQVIYQYCEMLGNHHRYLIDLYGPGNEHRLTGRCETASIDNFKYGVADRGASIRIPRVTEQRKKGYLEDRRPASNIDPYVSLAGLVDVTLLNANKSRDLHDRYMQFVRTLPSHRHS
jgi:glutamine synthetase